MIVEPKVRGFICTTAHPLGCKQNVKNQIDYVKGKGKIDGAKKVLVIGASTGYGLASRIVSAFGMGAATIGVMFEKETKGKRTATPGLYNTRAFDQFAKEEGLYAKSFNGDAFSKDMKEEVIKTIKDDLGKVDMVIYSLAAPRRVMEDGSVYNSSLKTTGEPFIEKNWNLRDNTITEAMIDIATKEEIDSTVKVMGGEDWIDWIEALVNADAIERDAITFAYSYIGPTLTYPVYHEGTIGMAKKHLKDSADQITEKQKALGVKAYISINKALVTQASSAIPIVPLYFAILYKVMKKKGIHEGCIEQMNRLYSEKVFGEHGIMLSENNMIRMDDWEMREDIQNEVLDIWKKIHTDNLFELSDTDGYWEDFYHMFGFRLDGVDYTQDVEV